MCINVARHGSSLDIQLLFENLNYKNLLISLYLHMFNKDILAQKACKIFKMNKSEVMVFVDEFIILMLFTSALKAQDCLLFACYVRIYFDGRCSFNYE